MIESILNRDKTKIVSHIFKKYKTTEEWVEIKGKFPPTLNMSDLEIAFCVLKNTSPKVCYCGNKARFLIFTKGYSDFCSAACANKSHSRIEKIKSTKLAKYGDAGFSNAEKRRATNLEKYGVENYTETESFAVKTKTTLKEKYGVENVSQIETVKKKKQGKCGNPEKYKKTVRSKKEECITYSKLLDSEWMKKKYEENTSVQISGELGVAFSTVCNYLEMHGIDRSNWLHRSGIEQEIGNFVESLGFRVVRNSRKVIPPKEIDILVPEKNLAIEVNGVYWHSIKCVEEDTPENINYHINKSEQCELLGIQLLHINDIEWNEKKDIWKSLIMSKLGVSKRLYARKCNVVKLERKIGVSFVENNHIQSSVVGGEYYGLEHQGVLVSVIQIGKPRFAKYDYEILRFCSILGTTVVGGFSKLLNASGISGSVVSYANRRWSNGNLYSKLRFNRASISRPNYWYINLKTSESGNRMRYQKHKLSRVLGVFDGTKTETENMFANGFIKYYDCGNITYVKQIHNK